MKMNRKNPYGDIGRENYWQTVRRRFLHHRLACISLVVLAVICTAAILAPVIAPYDPDAIAGPFGAPPGPGFLLGTDQIGRDMFSRLLYATRISLLVGVLATAISTAIGVSLGNMLNSAQSLTVLTKQPWLWIPPGLLIVVLVVAINFVGDALRDALDPSAVLNLGGAKQDTPEQDAAKQDTPDSL